MRSLLRPLRQVEMEIGEIEEGTRASLSEDFPTELSGVARNMNLLIGSERARSDRYRHTLDNLAHSLKTPLAAARALLADSSSQAALGDRGNEQIDRMDEIVRYQLRMPAASADKLVLKPVPVEQEVLRLVDGLHKVYRDKRPDISIQVEHGMQFRGDTGDFLELAGNLLDNACKWCAKRVQISIKPAANSRAAGIAGGMLMRVDDDGPGIPEAEVEGLLNRGTRLDESTPGHGIGLAIVKDIARSYGGTIEITTSTLGGARVEAQALEPLLHEAHPPSTARARRTRRGRHVGQGLEIGSLRHVERPERARPAQLEQSGDRPLAVVVRHPQGSRAALALPL